MRAYFNATLANFATTSDSEVLGALTSAFAKDGFASIQRDAIEAWEKQLPALRRATESLAKSCPESANWSLLLEYTIPRRQKRLDAVLLAGNVIFALEFKTGEKNYVFSGQRQVEDYALDLRDFHGGSRERNIVPVLVVLRAPDPPAYSPDGQDCVKQVALSNGESLGAVVANAYEQLHSLTSVPIDGADWEASPYRPVPSIIEATRAIFAGHDVREIAQSEAGATNLKETTDRLLEIIADAKQNRSRVICFVTGVPGAGKTLAGLNVAHHSTAAVGDGATAVFLSGNGPLVKIVGAAIRRDAKARAMRDSKRASDTFIQNIHTFIRTELPRGATPPNEHVIIFDEAQRAWNATHNERKTKQTLSEPELVLSIMDRHDWCVVIALVGGGQEINTGEAGLSEWGRSLRTSFPNWKIAVSPHALSGNIAMAGQPLFAESDVAGDVVARESSLHLNVNIRSYRTDRLTAWVEAVLAGRNSDASLIAGELQRKFPVVLTRSLESARQWLRKSTRGNRRSGLVASSGAIRLRTEGIELSSGFRLGNRDMYVNWFLNEPPDIRSSNQLEVAASEYECQGLELDLIGLCWGGDVTFDAKSKRWDFRHFTGKRWNAMPSAKDREYAINTYRVLLTRAREGMVIWVPNGSASDETRQESWFNETADFLRTSGASEI